MPVKKKSRHTDDGSICDSFICRYTPLDLAPIPIGGCRSVIGPFPRLLLMKDNVLLMVYIVPFGGYTVKVFFAFLENFLTSCYNGVTHRRALYPYCIRLDKMSQQPLSGGPASPYICRSNKGSRSVVVFYPAFLCR